MKHLTKLFRAILAIAIMLCVALPTFAHDFEVNGIYYNYLDKTAKTVAVTYKGSSYNSYSNEYTGAVSIPSSVTYNSTTYSVTSIGDGAFSKCTGLTSVSIPNSVTSIDDRAFKGCSGLTSVTIPNSVTSICFFAFDGCTGLTSVTIPNSVTTIGDHAFLYCRGLTSVTIPNSVTTIGIGAFFGCRGLTTVTIPNSVTTIGDFAFCCCRGLTTVTIPNSVTEIGDNAFRDCDNLDSVIITNPNTRYIYYGDDRTFDLHTKIIRLKQEEKSERDSYRWQYVSYGDDKCGAKSTDGKEIVPTEYSEVEYVPNYEGYFLVRKNGCYAIYNPSGKIIIPISRGYSSIIKTRSDGRIYYRVSKGGKYGVCGIDGYEIVAPLYDNIICIDGVFLYKDINGTWIPLNKGLDKNNVVVENPTYTKRDVAYYDLALQQGRLEDSFGKKVRVEQTSTEGTRAFKIVFEDKILFEFGEYDLSSSALDYIDKVAETLKELPSTRVRITGYTDNVGSLASNRLLSTQRANAVSEYLQQKGISASRIIAKGVPLADYVATNDTEEGRALNRRVEIIIEATGHRAK